MSKRLVPFFFPVCLFLLVAVATWKLTLGQRIIARGDLLLYFYPLRDYASQAVRELRLPLWNPYTFMGAPFLANSQAGVFYPLNILTAWLPVAVAVSWQIALHLLIGAWGAYVLARKGFALGRLAAAASAIAFGLGGYLGAQAEHLNQLQVLAWLPLLVALVSARVSASRRVTGLVWQVMGTAAVVALMITAGHTQSLYISLITAGLVLVAQIVLRPPSGDVRRWNKARIGVSVRTLLIFAGAVALAVVVCAVQLLPTLELSRESARAGGLSFGEVASFSWRPWVVARALLPTYGDPLFPEYVAYLGAAGLALATLGTLTRRAKHEDSSAIHAVVPLLLLGVGFVLALGVVTPVFNVLYKLLPGFNLFRAQARWLVMFALGAALLIGFGVQRLRDGLSAQQARAWLLVWLVVMGLMAIGLVAGARISLEAEYRSLPARSVILGWAVAAGIVTLLIVGNWQMAQRESVRLANRHWPTASVFVALLAAELLLASQFQPYSRAADQQAFTSLRPSTAHLLAEPRTGTGERVLALSSLFFDPGDKPEQELIYSPQLSADELYDRIIAAKHKEILSPNLPLYYRLPSVDGYDGGLLPTRRYAEFVKQFAQTPTGTVDGRLREFLKGVPADTWLDQMAVRYIIADKTQDIFVDGVYYDLLFAQPVTGGVSLSLAPYESTALGVIVSAIDTQPDDVVAEAAITFADATTHTVDIRATAPVTPYFAARLGWDGRKTPVALTIHARTPLVLRAITSIDAADKSFVSQPMRGDYDMRLVHSGDVKIYENLHAAARVVLYVGGQQQTLATLGGRVTEDAPERLRIALPTNTPSARLVVRDACYPGWVARVDGTVSSITCDGLFRSVALPANARDVVFSYEPQSVQMGAWLSGAGVLMALGLIAVANKKGSKIH